MPEQDTFSLEEYLDILVCRKWLLIIPAVVMTILMGVISLTIADVYRAETLILVEGQKIPEDFVKSPISIDLTERINTIREQITSQTRLKEIIREHHLYADMVAAQVPTQDLIAEMRRNIEIEVQGRNAFRVYFMGTDPYKVQDVVKALAESFIEESLVDREEQASGTLSFLDDELERVKHTLELQEQRVREFKQSHLGELPEQQEANQRSLDRLQEQLQTISQELTDAENRRVLLQSALNDLSSAGIASEGGGSDIVSINTQIERLEAKLADLRLRYTDNHPDVRKVRADIDELKAKARNSGGASGSNYEETSRNRELLRQMRQVEFDIQQARSERAKTRAEIRFYKDRVEAAPKVEAELQMLTRDYEKTKEEHDELLKKRQEAELAANLEMKQKGTQFKIVDPPQLPERPYKPNRARYVLIGLVLGLGMGLGAVFISEHFDKSFRDAAELEQTCDVAVLASIPTFTLRAQGQTARFVKIALLLVAAFVVSIGILLALLYLLGDTSPLDIIDLFGK